MYTKLLHFSPNLAKSPAEFVVSPVYGSTNTLNVSLIRPLEASNTLNDENRHPLLQRDDALLEPGSSSLIKNTGPDGLRAFLVQFKRLQDEHWEETEKEFDKVWQIVGNLIPGKKVLENPVDLSFLNTQTTR